MNSYSDENVSYSNDEMNNSDWIDIQKSTFTNWCNASLAGNGITITDLYKDLCDGIVLITLYETVSKKKVDKCIKTPKLITHRLANITLVLKEMANDGIKLVNIDQFDICDGNPKLILALIWHMILHYQIGLSIQDGVNTSPTSISHDNTLSKIPPTHEPYAIIKKDQLSPNDYTGPACTVTPKVLIMKWINAVIPHLRVCNLTTDWNNGKILAALIESLCPGACPSFDTWSEKNSLLNVTTALCLAEVHLGVPVLIEPCHMAMKSVDERSMITYLSYFTRDGGIAEKWALVSLKKKFPSVAAMVRNMTVDWSTGVALCTLVKLCAPKSLKKGFCTEFPDQRLEGQAYYVKCLSNLKYALSEAKQHLGIEPVVEAETIASGNAPALALIAYISSFLSLKTQEEREEDSDYAPELCTPDQLRISWISHKTDFRVGNFLKFQVSARNRKEINEALLVLTVYRLQPDGGTKKIVPFKKVWDAPSELYGEFLATDYGMYEVKVLYNSCEISTSPLETGYIYPIITDSDITIEGLNDEKLHPHKTLTFMVHSRYPIDFIKCAMEDVDTMIRSNCEVIKMSDKILKVNTVINHPGKYRFILIPSRNKEIVTKVVHCRPSKLEKIRLLTPNDMCIKSGDLVEIKVDASEMRPGKLSATVRYERAGGGGGSTCEKLEVSPKETDCGNGNWVISFPTHACGSHCYTVSFFWNGLPASDEKVVVNTLDLTKADVSHDGFAGTIKIKTPLDLKVDTRNCGSVTEVVGLMKYIGATTTNNNIVAPIKIHFKKVDQSIFEGNYQVPVVGTYILSLAANGQEIIPSTPKKIEAIDLQVVSYEVVSSPLSTGENIVVKVNIPTEAGRGDLFYAMEGPEGPMKVCVEPVFADEKSEIYMLQSCPKKPGIYRLLLTFGGFSLSGFPREFQITEKNKVDVTKVWLDRAKVKTAIVGSRNSFEIIVKEKAGEAELHGYLEYLTEEDSECSRRQHIPLEIFLVETSSTTKVYCVSYHIPHATSDLRARIFYGSEELVESPFNISAVDLSSIEVRSPSDEDGGHHRCCSVLVGERYVFTVFVPKQNANVYLNASITGPTGITNHPELREFYGPQSPLKEDREWEGKRRGVFYQIEFCPSQEGKHSIDLSVLQHSLPGFPKIYHAKKPAPCDESLVSVNLPANSSFKVGELCSVVVDGRATSAPGQLRVVLTGPSRESVPVSITPVLCKKSGVENTGNVYQLNFNLEVPGKYYMIVLWNDERVPGSPFVISAASSMPEPVLRGGVLGDGLVGVPLSVVVDNVYCSPEQLSCLCYDSKRSSIKTTLRRQMSNSTAADGCSSYLLEIFPRNPGMHQLEIKFGEEHIKGSPFYFKVCAPVNPSNVYVYGPGVTSGVLGPQKGMFHIQTDSAGAGILQVAVRGPKDGFRLVLENKEHCGNPKPGEDPCIVNVDYNPHMHGFYVISVLWSGEHVPRSPFEVYNCDNERDLNDIMNNKVPQHYLVSSKEAVTSFS